jgi:heptosyltransferase-3
VNIAKELLSKELEALFLLGPAEVERLRPAEEAHIHGTAKCMSHLSLTQVVGLLSCADAFIGNDSGVTQLAAGMGLRTFAMFGPTDPALYRPIGPALTVFRDMESSFTDRPSPELQKAVLDALSS